MSSALRCSHKMRTFLQTVSEFLKASGAKDVSFPAPLAGNPSLGLAADRDQVSVAVLQLFNFLKLRTFNDQLPKQKQWRTAHLEGITSWYSFRECRTLTGGDGISDKHGCVRQVICEKRT